MGKKKAIQEQELKEHEQNTLSSHYLFGVDLGLGEALILLNCVLYLLIALALVLNEMSEKLGCLKWWWLGGIYSPNYHFSRWGGCLSMGAPDSPVRQPRHPTIRVLTVSTVGALTSWGTRQPGAAVDRYLFTGRCASDACSYFCAHCSRTVHTFADDRCAVSRCSAWCTRQSGEL
jgi:hypothetical protein